MDQPHCEGSIHSDRVIVQSVRHIHLYTEQLLISTIFLRMTQNGNATMDECNPPVMIVIHVYVHSHTYLYNPYYQLEVFHRQMFREL